MPRLEGMRIERHVVLPAAAEEVWAALVDWERQASWMQDAEQVQVVSAAREGKGTILIVKTRVLNVPLLSERLEVVAWEPPAMLRIAHKKFVAGTGEWRLEPAQSGTRFIWTEDLALPIPILGELALRAYRPLMGRLMKKSLDDFRRLVISMGPRRQGSG